jgi:hypothetical protein
MESPSQAPVVVAGITLESMSLDEALNTIKMDRAEFEEVMAASSVWPHPAHLDGRHGMRSCWPPSGCVERTRTAAFLLAPCNAVVGMEYAAPVVYVQIPLATLLREDGARRLITYGFKCLPACLQAGSCRTTPSAMIWTPSWAPWAKPMHW